MQMYIIPSVLVKGAEKVVKLRKDEKMNGKTCSPLSG